MKNINKFDFKSFRVNYRKVNLQDYPKRVKLYRRPEPETIMKYIKAFNLFPDEKVTFHFR